MTYLSEELHHRPMADTDIKEIGLEDEYYHVRFRDPDRFERIRTPDWAANVAESVSHGGEIRMGQLRDSDEWEIQAILIKKQAGSEDKAREQALKIVEKLEE